MMVKLGRRALLRALCVTLFALTLVILGTLSSELAYAATVRYATPGGLTSGACDSWANACDLQRALTVALSGDEIWVQQGTHTPTTGTDRTATFRLKNGVALYGGFVGTETLRTQRNWVTNVTTLSGEIGAPGISDNSYHIVTGTDFGSTGSLNSTAILDGFTISGGNANGDSNLNYDIGGGLCNCGNTYGKSASPTVRNIIFSNNAASYAGGALFNWYGSSPTLTNVTFSNNTAVSLGGAMDNYRQANPTLTNVTFMDNTTNGWGGALSARGAGGAIEGSNPTLINVTFTRNSAWEGGAIHHEENSNPVLTNVTLVNNSARNAGGAISNINTGTPGDYSGFAYVRNSIVWGNTAPTSPQIQNDPSDSARVIYSDVQGGYAGTGNISTDPLLGVLGNYGGATQTIPILAGSPAIDTASDSVCPATDQRGVLRPQGAHCDMGAYEFIPQIFKLAPSPITYTIGATITYDIRINLAEGVTQNLVVTDTLPSVPAGGLVYVSHQVITTAAASNGHLIADFNGTVTPSPIFTNSSPTLLFDFGSPTTPTDNDPTNKAFLLRLVVRVADVPGNQAGSTLTNSAALRYTGADNVSGGSQVVTVVEPKMEIGKTITPNRAAANDTVTFTLVVTNSGTSAAYDVIVGDPLSNNYFTAITEGTTPTGFTFGKVPGPTTTTVQYTNGTLAAGDSATFTFNAALTAGAPPDLVIANTASITQAKTLPAGIPNARNEPTVSASATLTVTVPDLAVTKTDGVNRALPGQTLVYTITVSNIGGRDATGVVLTDTISAYTTFVSASGSYSRNGNTLTWSAFDLGSGLSTTRWVTVTVTSPLSPNVLSITNTARAADDGAHGADPTPADDIASDTDPTFYRDYFPWISRMAPPTPTPTPTRTSTPTPSITPTPTPTRVMIAPQGMVSDLANDHLYLVSNGDGSVDIFKESTLTNNALPLKKVAVGRGPFGIGLINNKVYVANYGSDTVSVIDVASMNKTKDIALGTCGRNGQNGGQPAHLAVDSNNNMVYVALHASARVAVIDSTADTLAQCIPVTSDGANFGGTFGIAVDAYSSSVFVGNRDTFDLWRIDDQTHAASRVKNFAADGNGGSPFYIGVNDKTGKLFVIVGFYIGGNMVPNRLYVYDIDASGNLLNETVVSVGNTDDGGYVLQSQCSAMIFIAEMADNQLRILNGDLTQYAALTPSGGLIDNGPFGLLENVVLSRIYVSNKTAGTLRVLNECPGPVGPSKQIVVPTRIRAATSPARIATPLPRTPTATATRTTTPTPRLAVTPRATPR